jgi:hypothetical protein
MNLLVNTEWLAETSNSFTLPVKMALQLEYMELEVLIL